MDPQTDHQIDPQRDHYMDLRINKIPQIILAIMVRNKGYQSNYGRLCGIPL